MILVIESSVLIISFSSMRMYYLRMAMLVKLAEQFCLVQSRICSVFYAGLKTHRHNSCFLLPLSKSLNKLFFIISSIKRICTFLGYTLSDINNIQILRMYMDPNWLFLGTEKHFNFLVSIEWTSCSPFCRFGKHCNLRSNFAGTDFTI